MSSKCRGGGQTCCVPGCDNNTLRDKNVSFHAFPANEKEKKEWVRRINRQGSAGRFSLWQPSKHHRICGAHFNASGRRGYMDRLPTIFPHKVINQLSLSFNTVAKRKKTSSKTASASPVLLLNELEIGCVVDVPQCDRKSDAVSKEPTQLTFGAPASPRTETEGADHSYSMGPPDAASAAALRKVAHLLEHCEKLEHENSLLRKDKSELQKEVEDLKSQLHDVKVQALKEKLKLKDCVSKVHDFVSDEKRLVFYTGFNSFKKFDAFVEHVECMYQTLKTGAGRPPALTMKEQLIAVLCRLRVGLLEQDLAYRLKVSVATVSAMYSFWVNFLYEMLIQVPMWPSRNTVDLFMPDNFKELYPSTRIVLDCTEIFIENPSDYKTQSDTFSSYKGHNTAKGLIGITPNGFVSFVSNLAPGRLSDREITRHSGLYELLEEGDSVMADRGFLIEDDLRQLGVKLNMPPMLNGRTQLSLADELATRQIASLRIHVERVIREVKNFRILRAVFPNVMAEKLNKIWKICCFLNNFMHEPILNR
ncbi:uncharacterized protein LOC144098950 [Amblyomma americanum]